MRVRMPLSDSNQPLYLFIVILGKSGLHQLEAVILEDCQSVPTLISPLRPGGNFMYRMFYTSTKYKYRITAGLCVSYDYQNREKIFPYTTIASLLF